jgi:N-acetylglucosaminyldiphosphoundecaprenol N-acetyl-beta-D-mannosaminyltransferase
MHYRSLGIPCCIGVGATIDFLAGEVSRAPSWMGRVGLEWVYRLAQEPRRLAGRYAKDIWFLCRRTWKESQVIHRANRTSEEVALPAMPEFDEGMEVLRWHGILTSARAAHFPSPSYRTAFIVDLSGVTSVDSRGLGIMLRLVREAWKAEVGVCFYAATPAVLSVLELTRLDRIVPMATAQIEARVVAAKDSHLHALRSQSDADSLVVQMPARITAGNAEDCAQTLKQAWQNNPDKAELVLSMEDTTFIDSSGLGFLVRAHRMVGARSGASLRLLEVGSNVENVIRVARLNSIFLQPPQEAKATAPHITTEEKAPDA